MTAALITITDLIVDGRTVAVVAGGSLIREGEWSGTVPVGGAIAGVRFHWATPEAHLRFLRAYLSPGRPEERIRDALRRTAAPLIK